jgi:hypothetical protein
MKHREEGEWLATRRLYVLLFRGWPPMQVAKDRRRINKSINIYARGPRRVPSSQLATPAKGVNGEAPPCDPFGSLPRRALVAVAQPH